MQDELICACCGKPKKKLVEAWQGHRYGLQALKPAVEPIIVFQKPYEGKPIENITQTGAGTLNIDAARIPLATGDEYSINTFDDGMKPFGNGAGHKYKTLRRSSKGGDNGLSGTSTFKIRERHAEDFPEPSGRWPANLLLDDVSAGRLDRQTGTLTSGIPSGKKKAGNNIYGEYANEDVDVTGFGDSGGASRFFYTVSSQIDESDPVYYCAKVSPKERNAGLDEMPVTLGGSLDGGNDTRNGKDKPQLHETRNSHPTVKPIALAKYLATLLLPPEEYAPRRILVPFSGVGSEMCGAAQAGWEQICGIEFDTENGYVDIAHKRMEYWSNK
jgi:hypothetical protein